MLWTSMEKEQISPAPRVFDGILDKFLDCTRLVRALDLLSARAKRERSLLLFDAHMSNAPVELHSERKDVVQVGAVAHDEAAVGLVREDFLRSFRC